MSKMESGSIVSGNVASYAGATTAVVSGLSASEIGIWIGSIVAVLGLIFTQYWAWRRDKRQKAEAQARQAERKFRMQMMEKTGMPFSHKETDLGQLETES